MSAVTAGDVDDAGRARPDHLLALALSRPTEAFTEATELLSRRPDAYAASIARQARAIVLRDTGRTAEAIAELRRAVRLAVASMSAERLGDVQATMGLTLGMAGRVAEGLAALDHAVDTTHGVLAGRVLMRRAYLFRLLGRYEDALADLRRSIKLLHKAGDPIWEARSRSNRFLVYAALGRARQADRDLVLAQRLLDAAGQDLEVAMTVHSRADVAFQRGDLPAALGFLDEAAARYEELGAVRPNLAIDRCAVLLAAGLATEAVAVAEEAIRRHLRRGGEVTKTPELLFAAARAAQAAGRSDIAGKRATAARDLFRRQGRQWWQARASLVAMQARYARGDRSVRLARQASDLADSLAAMHAEEAPSAHLFAARLATDRGLSADADRHLARAAQFRHRGPTFGHAAGWLAHALRAEGRGATAATLVACRRGLEAAGDHQRTLAAPELRAHAAAYGVELAALGQRHAVRRRDPRMLLQWSERWRANALAVPSIHPPDDRELAADLAALRGVAQRLNAARSSDVPTDRLDQERRHLESAIRSRTRRTIGGGEATSATMTRGNGIDSPSRLVEGLGEHRLVEITALDGRLFAITVVGRRFRLHEVGPVASAVREIELARFMLRRLAYGRAAGGALGALDVAGRRLQEVLLGPAAGDLDGTPTVVVPPAPLHAVPWAMLPALRASSVTVAPSANTWLRAGETRVPRGRRVALVIGPGLHGSAAEVKQIGRDYADAVVLADGRATAQAAMSVLDGAWTAHIAAHGVFRGDNPLFSAIYLDDGPLTVYDLARLRQAPYRLVLSSCESGMAAHVGGDELLGAASALVPLGTASLLASVVPVNDAATAPLMVDFHERLRAGAGFGAALHGTRAALDDDPVAVATALSFVALGR